MNRPKGYTPGLDPNAHKFVDGYSCSGAMDASLKCVTQSNFDDSKCEEYFKVYRECKKQWLTSQKKQ